MRTAKAEAERDIAAFRADCEAEFQKKISAVFGTTSPVLVSVVVALKSQIGSRHFKHSLVSALVLGSAYSL